MQTTISHDHTQQFWDSIAPKYAQKRIGDPTAYEAKLSRIRALLKTTDRVLEIGCGTGSTALRLAPDIAHITATDVSRGMINIAQAKFGPDAPANVTFQQADAADLVEGRPFDAICAFSLLHLIEDVPNVLGRIHEQLKPGGLFISKTVCLKDGSFMIRALVPALAAIGIAPLVTILGADELRRFLCDAGFEVKQIAYLGAKRTNPFIVARRTTV
jgi:ubiquinone/menaquinone biosynthesis C-methylase UbiE